MTTVKIFDDNGKLIREGKARVDEQKGFVVRYELLAIIFIMLTQTMGGIWWASATNTNLYNVKNELTDIKSQLQRSVSERFTAADAERAHNAIEKRIDKHEDRITSLETYHIKGGK